MSSKENLIAFISEDIMKSNIDDYISRENGLPISQIIQSNIGK